MSLARSPVSSAAPAVVVLNPAARHGRARELFARAQPVVASRYRISVVEMDAGGAWAAVTALPGFRRPPGRDIFIAAVIFWTSA